MKTALLPTTDVCRGFKPTELPIIAAGTACFHIQELDEIRKGSLRSLPKYLSPQLLRHSDNQTLASLAAVSDAIRRAEMAATDFHDWAIVSASRSLGRSDFAAVINKYKSEGPWGVSVQVIPHCTTHAVAGTISLALNCHGPCIGAGFEVEALYSTACLLSSRDSSHAWIIFSSWSPELAIDRAGRPTSDSHCIAAAIAVTREATPQSLGRISFTAPLVRCAERANEAKCEPLSPGLTEFLLGQGAPGQWSATGSAPIHIQVDLNGDHWCAPEPRSVTPQCDLRRRAELTTTDFAVRC
jgi:hypothetical protein